MRLDLEALWLSARKAVVFITHSIDEAVLLADRVVVMSPAPGRIEQVIEIRMPRPRGLEHAAILRSWTRQSASRRSFSRGACCMALRALLQDSLHDLPIDRHRRGAVPADAAGCLDRLDDASGLHRLDRGSAAHRHRDEHGCSEGPSLDHDEQLEVLACREAIGDACPRSGPDQRFDARCGALGHGAEGAGAQGLAVFPPFPTFLGNPVPSEMIYQYHKAIADGVGLLLIAFQFPKSFGPDFPPETLSRLCSIPEVVGLKEASFDTTKTIETIDAAKTLPRKLGILTGSDTFIWEAMVMGCDGRSSASRERRRPS